MEDMKQPTLFDRILDWLFKPHYDCAKGKHEWCYTLSQSGIVYRNEEQVPKNLWHCAECGIKKYPEAI